MWLCICDKKEKYHFQGVIYIFSLLPKAFYIYKCKQKPHIIAHDVYTFLYLTVYKRVALESAGGWNMF